MDTKLMVPRDFTAKLLLWKDVSYHDMELIDQMQTIPDLERTLCSVLGVDLPEPKKGVLLELYVQTVLFCREQHFNKEQTSALLSIIKSIHEANVGEISGDIDFEFDVNVFIRYLSTCRNSLNNSEQCLRYSNDLLLCHSVRRPPFSINLFSFQEANCILNHIQDHYLRHYRLYKFIFTPQVKLDLFLTYSGTAEQGPSAAEHPSVPDAVINMREEEADPKRSDSSQTQETTTTEEEEASDGSTDIKTLIEREVEHQMQQVSRQLDERIRGAASEHNNGIHDANPTRKGKTKPRITSANVK